MIFKVIYLLQFILCSSTMVGLLLATSHCNVKDERNIEAK
jgi:hypothetical protein